MPTKRLTRLALLTAIALTIFLVELQIPAPVPIPGIKLGLSNIVTIYCVCAYGPWSALAVLVCRVVLGSIFAGRMAAIAYSLAGGLLSWALMCALRRRLPLRQLWVASVLGGVAHNAGQLLVAVAVTATPLVAIYFPLLAASGMAAGLFTGICAQLLLRRIRKIHPEE